MHVNKARKHVLFLSEHSLIFLFLSLECKDIYFVLQYFKLDLFKASGHKNYWPDYMHDPWELHEIESELPWANPPIWRLQAIQS